ncbi:MAG TPA: GlsB/YeaQ/YmgE family stress response membrane protein [Ktedonobacteraceae bacterium]|nr:GlsB/YeaQ/YmgE family stress response membrane protein [Ktedonobacteraceae bacterium]
MHLTLENIIVWFIIALIGGFIGEFIARRRAPDGIVGATIIGFIGILLVVGLLNLHFSNDQYVAGIPLFTSLLVAAIFVALWSALAYRHVYRRGYERYYHRRGSYVRRPRRRRFF